MAILGHADGMVGSYVVGWAVAVPDSGNCAISITDEQGNILGNGRASRHRPDLASLGLGRTTLAFRIQIKLPEAPCLLNVLADGEALPGSPIACGPNQFDGDATVEGAYVAGWVTERAAGAAPPEITIVNQYGALAGHGAAIPDATSPDPFFTPARFKIPLAPLCFGAGEMRLTILANGVAFATGHCDLKLAGNLEQISASACAGWLIAPATPERVFDIEIYRDGVLAGTTRSEFVRDDLRELYPQCTTPGFHAALGLPAPKLLEPTSISLRLAGSDIDLFEGPYLFASRPATAAAAHRVARLGHLGLPGIGPLERAMLERACGDFLLHVRAQETFIAPRQAQAMPAPVRPRLVIIIPVYKDVDVTHACIDSVLAHRNPETDFVVLVNDASPEPEMAGMLAGFAARPNLFVLKNEKNLGFVQSINRGLSFAAGADALLLNADTFIHAGGFDELHRVAYAAGDIGTVTAMSNNATIFSYPHADLRRDSLPDITWPELAATALEVNEGKFTEVPTGHGFCMLIKGELTRQLGLLDEAFGRGYGEENDFCARAAAVGYRHVAAAGVLVEHKESLSFGDERAGLLIQNLPRLNRLYPEYTPLIMEFERNDGLRGNRWALDRVRLGNARARGQTFVLVISNRLEGGTARAIADFERHTGYGGAEKLSLSANAEGYIELKAENPLLHAVFRGDETAALLDVLSAADPAIVHIHHLLGFPATFITALASWLAGRQSHFTAHDFYSFCPRVTMLDATGQFCDAPDAATCARCVDMGGAHESSRLTELTPAEHRALFAGLLGCVSEVTAPSASAAGYLRRVFPDISVDVRPHPESTENLPSAPREGDDKEIILLGAIGPHKGSATLLALARRARLTHPHLKFRVIGYTDIDKALSAIGNVTITGKYATEELPALLAATSGRLALFLSPWPETYSYTLSEAVRHGFIPLVPDLGAPAERVRAARYGLVFPANAGPVEILALLDDITSGGVPLMAKDGSPERFFGRTAQD